MLIEGQFAVAAPPAVLIQHLFDARFMASCLPGCEALEPLADDRYRAVVVVALAGISARFNLQVEVTRKDAAEVWSVTRGEEGSNASSLHAESRITLQPSETGTLLNYRSEVSVTGRLGRFGLGMMKKKAQAMGEEFADKLRTELERAHPAADAAVPAVSPEPAAAALPRWQRWWQALVAWWRGQRRTLGTGHRG